jgi:predicted Zn-dependent peptidase
VLVVNGNIDWNETKSLIDKYFGKIKSHLSAARFYPSESPILEHRSLTLHKELPEEGFYYAFHSSGRIHPDFYAIDFMTDMLSEGKSSMLYSRLKKEKMICSAIDCYITATTDPGLIIVEAKINPDHTIEEAEAEFWNIIDELQNKTIPDHNWEKYMNKNESAYLFSQLGVINQALNLSYAEWLGNPNLVYTELENYKNLTKEQIELAAKTYFQKEKRCSLYYRHI